MCYENRTYHSLPTVCADDLPAALIEPTSIPVRTDHGGRASLWNAARHEALEFRLLEASAQIVRVHYRNNFDFRVEMVKKRLARHDEP
jgi:hypothetical protein